MRKKKKIWMAICLSAVLACGTIGAAAYAAASDSDGKEAEEKDTVQEAVEQQEPAAEKDETVYVLAGADGSVNKIIVSDWIKNTLGSASLKDASELTDVVNVKGEESYTMNGANMRVWDADGNDIYYQGNIEKELPVKLSVTYMLDGKTVSPSELAGKSGHLTMRFDYENNQYETVDVDGKQEKIYVPFAMVTGMILDNDVFRNVEVSNGKLINDGNHTVVIGLAFPGMQENLAIEKEDFEIPDYVEISADVYDFELMTTMTVAANEIFNEFDDANLEDFDELSESLGELTDAMNQLMDGSAQLYEGLNTLYEKSGDLMDGVNQLAEGAKTLKDGAGELAAGTGELDAGAADLVSGINQANGGAGTLADGSAQVDDGVSSLADGAKALDSGAGELLSGMNQIADGAGNLSAGTADLSAGASQLKAGTAELAAGLDTLSSNSAALNEGAKQVFETLLAQANSQLAAAGIGVDELTIDNYESVLSGEIASLQAFIEQNMASEQETVIAAVQKAQAGVSVLASLQAQLDSYNEFYQGIIAYTKGVDSAAMGASALKDGASNIDEGAAALSAGADALKSGIDTLKDGAGELKAGTFSLAAGADTLKAGTAALKAGAVDLRDGLGLIKTGAGALKAGTASLRTGASSLDSGAAELYNGILVLKDGSDALTDGVRQLRDGSIELSDGLRQFNEEGIQKLTDAVDGDLNGLITRIRVTADVSKNYKSFSGVSEEMDGQVKFIYRTDSIKKY